MKRDTEATMESALETMLRLHSSSATFREIFRSQQATQVLIDSYKAYVTRVAANPNLSQWTLRILEKLSNLGLALALDNAVGAGQKREVSVKISHPASY